MQARWSLRQLSWRAARTISRGMKALQDFMLFASDAEELVLVGAAFLMLALLALVGDRRRTRRHRTGHHLDRVGWMPWTTLFMVSMIIGGGLLAFALPQALSGK